MFGVPALSLHRIHHVLLLRQERVAKIGGPAHVVAIISSTEWNGRSACTVGIPRKMIRLDRVGQGLRKVTMLTGPARRIWNLVGIRRGGQFFTSLPSSPLLLATVGVCVAPVEPYSPA